MDAEPCQTSLATAASTTDFRFEAERHDRIRVVAVLKSCCTDDVYWPALGSMDGRGPNSERKTHVV